MADKVDTARPPEQDRAKTRSTVDVVMGPLNAAIERYMPSAFLFAVALTVVVAAAAMFVTDASPVDALRGWGEGLSGLLAFTMQMVLILLLGYMLAHTGPVHGLLIRLGSLPKSEGQAYIFVVVVTAVASLITWGLGLVVGAVIAKEVARQGKARGLRLHFPLLVACGYSGWVVWHMGYSGSGPLAAATEGSFVHKMTGQVVPMSETTFSLWNMIGAVVTVVVISAAMYLVRPRNGSKIVEVAAEAESAPYQPEVVNTPADRLDASRLPTLLLGLALASYLAVHFVGGGTLTLDIVNWSFMMLILLLVRNAAEMLALVRRSASNVGDVVFQYPLYAGILGIMVSTGLMGWLTERMIAISNEYTFGIIALIAAGFVNIFVPSGGAQFAVQGPIMLDAAQALGVDPAVAIMAVSYGDQWSNMIQPFWALPLLAIAGLKIRDIMGYTTVTFLVSGFAFAGTLLVASFIL